MALSCENGNEPAKKLSASQEGLRSIELICYTIVTSKSNRCKYNFHFLYAWNYGTVSYLLTLQIYNWNVKIKQYVS
jgi:hypothetical protein